MIIDNPVVILSSAPLNRPLVGDRPGGGSTAVITETPRALDAPEQAAASRRNGIDSDRGRGDRSARDDVEMAARMRVGVARERSVDFGESPNQPRGRSADVDRGEFISAAEMRQLRDRLEARLARDPGILTLRSVDVLT